MKMLHLKKHLAVMVSIVMLICSFAGTFTVSAAQAQIYIIDGTKYVFAHADGTLTYDGTAYGAYATFELAYKAIAPTGGTIVVEGTHTLYTESTTTTAIEVIGLGKSATTLNLPNAYPASVYGELYLKDLTLGHLNSGKRFKADRLTLDNVADGTGSALWYVGFVTGQTNGATCYLDVKAGSALNLIGIHEYASIASGRSDNMYFIIDGGSIHWDPRNGQPVHGNLTYIVNNSSGMSNKKISTQTDPDGALTVIFNNGITDVTVSDTAGNVDYRVNVAAGGYADIKIEGSADTAPTFVITSSNGLIPVINGQQLPLTDGEYLYTPTTKGTVDITFIDTRIYTVDGEATVFVAADGEVAYNGENYNAYSTFELAYKSIIGEGGTIVVEGEHTLYTEKTASNPIKILGLGINNSKLLLPGSYNTLYGEIEIDKITLSTTIGSGDAHIAVNRFTIGKNMQSAGNLWFTGYVSTVAGELCYLVHNGKSTAFLLNVSQLSWPSTPDADIQEIYNGGYVNFDIQINAAAKRNLTYVFDSVAQFNQKAVSVRYDAGYNLSLIFNNGITDMQVNDDNGYVDYRLNVASGGYAYVKEQGTATTAPTFVILPSEHQAPCVNGEKLSVTNGEYLYTPTEKGTFDITFVDSEEPRVYLIDNAYFAFAAKDGKIEYQGKTHYAFETYELAYKALAIHGGTLVVEGKHALYSEKTTKKPIKVIGADDDATVTFGSSQCIYGDTEFDNIRFQTATNSSADTMEFMAAGNLLFGKNVKFGAMNSIGFVGLTSDINSRVNAGDTVTLKWASTGIGSAGEVFYVRALRGTIGTADKKINVQLIMDGTGYTSTFTNGLGLSGNINGSFTFVINDSTYFYKKGDNKTISLTGTVSDKLTVIFNDGVNDVVLEETADTADYVLNVANGGYAYVKTEGTATTAPTFVIEPPAGKKPLINSVQIDAVNGEYLYTPSTSGIIDITFGHTSSYTPSVQAPANQKLAVTKLKTDSRKDPLGIDYTAPVLSWMVESTRRGAKQTAYRVGVASSTENIIAGNFDVWDSGKVFSSDTNITYGAVNGIGGRPAATLQAQTPYYWTVYAWNENSVENRSTQIAMFETALFGDFGSDNYWIFANQPTDGTAAETAGRLFRKQFTLSQTKENIVSARLYSTAAGNQIMYVNGKRAAEDYFAPGKSKYTKMFYYQTYDITALMRDGDNTIGAEVGQGWYNAGAVAATYGSDVALKAKLVVTYEDGTQQVINTDSTWQGTMQGATLSNRFYDGQVIDGREYIEGWAQNDNTSDKWQSVQAVTTFRTTTGPIGDLFIAENMDPVRNVMTFTPSAYEQKSETSRLYTFDQNIAGTVRITAKAKAGVTMTLKYGEFLTGGTITGTEYNGNNGIDSYTFRGDEGGETVTFDLVYHGFQYVLVSNESTDSTLSSEPIEIVSIEALVLSSLTEETYTFDSSNNTIDQYVQNVLWSLRSNFMSTITDCPTREKNTWTGDAQIIAGASAYFADVYNTYRNFQLMTQHSAFGDGGLPEIVPEATTNNASTSETQFVSMPAGWTDSTVIITWQMYNQYGDLNIINDNYATMKNFVDCLVRQRIYQEGDEIPYFVIDPTDLRMDGGKYGDWLGKSNGNANASYYEKTYYSTTYNSTSAISFVEIGTAYLAHSCDLLSQMAEAIGNTTEATYYHDLYQRFAKAWRTNFVAADGYTCTSNGTTTLNEDGTPNTYTPGEGWVTSYALGLEFNLFENEEMAKKAAAKLASLMENWEYQQMVGFLGIDTLYTGLSHNGQFEAALKIMENEKNPSALYSVTRGATTIWETYDEINYSRNHYVFGAPSRWLFSDVLGITHGYESENVGYTHFLLEPNYSSDLDTTLTWVSGSYTARTGTIKSEWKLSSDRTTFTYKCTVPANTSATVSLPLFGEKSAVTEGGIPATDSKGVAFVEIKDGRAYYEVTSGEYEFVVTDSVTELSVTPPTKRVYGKGSTAIDVTGGLVNVTYSGGRSETIELTADMITDFDGSVVGTQTVTVTYGGVSDTFDIAVMNTNTLPTVTVDSVNASVGKTFTVAVTLQNNPGITSANLAISYDTSKLELVSYNEQEFSGLSCGSVTDDPFVIRWQGADNTDTVFVLLTFQVKADTPIGTTDISVAVDCGNVLFNTASGTVNIAKYTTGDLNRDGLINNKDLGLMQRFNNSWSVVINQSAADVNGDGKVNNKDLGILQRYINGWDVTLS